MPVAEVAKYQRWYENRERPKWSLIQQVRGDEGQRRQKVCRGNAMPLPANLFTQPALQQAAEDELLNNWLNQYKAKQ